MKLTKEEKALILDSHDLIAEIEGDCYPPNVVEIRGNKVWYYGGFEDFLNWDWIYVDTLLKRLKG